MRWLVCGGRNYGHTKHERNFIFKSLDEQAMLRSKFYNPDDNWLPSDVHIISGMAKGVDTVAVDWAVVNWLTWDEYPADWEKYGKAAGYIRNRRMLEEGKPDLVIAFPGGKGTSNMIMLAEQAGVPVEKIEYTEAV